MSLRDTIQRLEKHGDLVRVRRKLDRYITKIGIDVTKPLVRTERFELAQIPGYENLDLKDYLS